MVAWRSSVPRNVQNIPEQRERLLLQLNQLKQKSGAKSRADDIRRVSAQIKALDDELARRMHTVPEVQKAKELEAEMERVKASISECKCTARALRESLQQNSEQNSHLQLHDCQAKFLDLKAQRQEAALIKRKFIRDDFTRFPRGLRADLYSNFDKI